MADFITGFSQIQGGIASKQLASYNAKVLKEQGKAAQQEAAWEADRLTRQGSRAVAEIAAGQSSGGLGFSREVLRDQILEAARGVELVNWEGQYAKTISQAQARIQQYQGRQKFYGGLFSAAGTFAGGNLWGLSADAFGGGPSTGTTAGGSAAVSSAGGNSAVNSATMAFV